MALLKGHDSSFRKTKSAPTRQKDERLFVQTLAWGHFYPVTSSPRLPFATENRTNTLPRRQSSMVILNHGVLQKSPLRHAAQKGGRVSHEPSHCVVVTLWRSRLGDPFAAKKNKTNALPRSESSTTRPEGWTIKPSERWHKQMNDKGLAYYLDLETGKSHWFPPCERCYKVRYTNRFVFWSHSTSFLCLCFSGSLPVVTQTRRYAANTSPPSPLRRLDWFNTFVDLPM